MSLYTSYYTRQLALRPESLSVPEALDGKKTQRAAIPRRTVDVTGPYCLWLQERATRGFDPNKWAGVQAGPAAALGLLPPVAMLHQPVSSAATTFAAQAPSKTRSSVNVVCWTPDGRRCLSGTQAGEFTMWDGSSFQFESILQAHDGPLRAMTYTRSGTFLVSGDDTGAVRYWKTNLELVKSTQAHRESLRGLSFAPSDLKFATASDDSTVRVWDFARVTAELVLSGHGGDVRCVDWNPVSAQLVSGSKDGLVKLWCPRAGRCIATLHGHRATVMQTAWNGNGNWVLSASRDAACKVWEARMRRELATFRGHARDVITAAWHPTHEDLFVSGGADGGLLYWLASRPDTPQGEVPAAHEGSVWTAAWHPAGHLLATGAADYATKFWCRRRPGDPFFEQQAAAQAEAAAAAEHDGVDFKAAAATRASDPVRAAAAPLQPLRAQRHGGIPGLGGVAPGLGPVPAAAGPGTAQPSTSAFNMFGGLTGGPATFARDELAGTIPGLSMQSLGAMSMRAAAPSRPAPLAGPRATPEPEVREELEAAAFDPELSLEDQGPSKRLKSVGGQGIAEVRPAPQDPGEAWHGEAIVLPAHTPHKSGQGRGRRGRRGDKKRGGSGGEAAPTPAPRERDAA